MANYTTAAAVKLHKVRGAAVDLTAYTDAEILAEIELAEFVVEKYTGTIFYTLSDTSVYLNGNGDRVLFTYPTVNYPLISVDALVEVDEFDQTLWTFTAPDDYYADKWFLSKPWRGGYSARQSSGWGNGGVWPRGIRNIKVTGTWGLATVPGAVVRAVTLLTLESMYPGSTQLTGSAGIQSEAWEDYRVQYGTKPADTSAVDTTGLDYVDVLLDSFRVTPALFLTPEVHAPQ